MGTSKRLNMLGKHFEGITHGISEGTGKLADSLNKQMNLIINRESPNNYRNLCLIAYRSIFHPINNPTKSPAVSLSITACCGGFLLFFSIF